MGLLDEDQDCAECGDPIPAGEFDPDRVHMRADGAMVHAACCVQCGVVALAERVDVARCLGADRVVHGFGDPPLGTLPPLRP